MGWTKSVTLWCDGEGCNRHSGEQPTSKVSAARANLAEKGWTHEGGKDYCPVCSGNQTPGERHRAVVRRER